MMSSDIARQKNAEEPKDVEKNWMRLKNTIEYMGLWEKLNNPQFKGVGFDPLFQEAGSNAFTKLTNVSSSGGLLLNSFNATVISHTFENGKGVITLFDGVVTSIGESAFYG